MDLRLRYAVSSLIIHEIFIPLVSPLILIFVSLYFGKQNFDVTRVAVSYIVVP